MDQFATQTMPEMPLGLARNIPVNPGLLQDVRITKVENGFIVFVGCKQFVSESFTEVSKGLELYFKDPRAAQEKYCSKS